MSEKKEKWLSAQYVQAGMLLVTALLTLVFISCLLAIRSIYSDGRSNVNVPSALANEVRTEVRTNGNGGSDAKLLNLLNPIETPLLTQTSISTPTPTPSPTDTDAPTPYPGCGPTANYYYSQSSGVSIVAGSTDIGNHGDDVMTIISLPFAYSLYGTSFTSLTASSNGNVQFSSYGTAYSNICLPDTSHNNIILPYWDDLRTDTCAGCGIYTSISGSAPNRIFNIEWRTAYYSSVSQRANFEVRLYEGREQFDVVYGQVDQSGSGATVGVQRGAGAGEAWTQYECNSGGLFSGLQLTFTYLVQCTPGPTVTGTPPTATQTSTPSITPTRQTDTPTTTRPPTRTPTPCSACTSTPTPCAGCPTPMPTQCPGAYHYLAPEAGAPANGGTVTVGQRFVLDLRVNTGPYAISAQGAYLTFTYSLLQNVNVTQPGCVLTSTLTPDREGYLEFVDQNEVCNGPASCVFHGGPTDPGSIAYVSDVGSLPPDSGDSRVAQVGLCATAPGQAIIHWQFSPPAPPQRDTYIDDASDQSCYVDYVINIVASPTQTPTPVPTPRNILVGHVEWQGPPAQPDERQQLPVTLTLKSSSAEINYPVQTTDASGYFTVSVEGLALGVYDWRVKGARYLARSGSVELAGSASTNLDVGLMKAGDANNDNIVGSADFNMLKNMFGMQGQPGELSPDFNNDTVVNISDFELLTTNFGQSGAPPVGP